MINVDSIRILLREPLQLMLAHCERASLLLEHPRSSFQDPDGVILVFIESYTKESAEILKADETFREPPQS